MNNNKTHKVEKLTIINAKQSLMKIISHIPVVRIRVLIGMTVVRIRILIGTTVVRIASAKSHSIGVMFRTLNQYIAIHNPRFLWL